MPPPPVGLLQGGQSTPSERKRQLEPTGQTQQVSSAPQVTPQPPQFWLL